jgi:hypothetical protein
MINGRPAMAKSLFAAAPHPGHLLLSGISPEKFQRKRVAVDVQTRSGY